MPERNQCPFAVGDLVRFTPTDRTRGHYQNIDGYGIAVGEVKRIEAIRDDTYLYFANGAGGWPWKEFTRAD